MLTLTSCQAPNSEVLIESLATHLSDALGEDAQYVADILWQQRASMLDAGQIDVGWICSLPYVRNADARSAAYDLLAAPVRSNPRYKNTPVYFSDVVVRSDSAFRRFEELRGTRWGFNEPTSFSGYTVARAHLASMGETYFFGTVTETGSHENAMAMITEGTIDGAAIDSTVLERQRLLDPDSVRDLRVIATFGPNPAPPLVMSKSLDPELAARLQHAVLHMHLDPAGREALTAVQVSRFAPVNDSTYDPIRAADNKAASVQW